MDTENTNRILLFTGDGKGKTTAALGMALRAAGHGMKSLVVQFVKSDKETGELASVEDIPEIKIVQTGKGFVPDTETAEFQIHKQCAESGLWTVQEALMTGTYQLVILDEICIAVSKNLLNEQQVLGVIEQAHANTIIVMTGRNASQGLVDVADTVTEMKCVKHGHRQNIQAQQGVEY
jgi:cob(I)alamin adenosyltransferase